MSHIDDGSLELFALGRVSQVEIVAIEEHLLVCLDCHERFLSIREFATAAVDAARITTTELIATHHTEDGPVHLYVRRTGVDDWLATMRGEIIDGGVSAPTRQEAVDQSLASFRELFPEHRCNSNCFP